MRFSFVHVVNFLPSFQHWEEKTRFQKLPPYCSQSTFSALCSLIIPNSRNHEKLQFLWPLPMFFDPADIGFMFLDVLTPDWTFLCLRIVLLLTMKFVLNMFKYINYVSRYGAARYLNSLNTRNFDVFIISIR